MTFIGAEKHTHTRRRACEKQEEVAAVTADRSGLRFMFGGGDGEMDERLTSGQLETAEPPFMTAAEKMRGARAAIHQRRLVARRGQ